MSDDSILDTTETKPRTNRRAEKPRRSGCLPMAIAVVLALVVVFFGGRYAWDRVSGVFGDAPDYEGPGTGQVSFEVHEGDSITAMGRNLKSAGVVKSVDAFTTAAKTNDKATSIQVGFYSMKKQMKASQALDVLTNPKNLVKDGVLVREGARVKDIVAAITQKAGLPKADVEAALKNPAAIGLPPEAKGNPEGWLYPATYEAPPGTTAAGLLKQMVAKTVSTMEKLDVAGRSGSVDLSPEQVLTMASLLEYEGSRAEDLPKIARVFYNRIAKGMALQSDATVAYANNLTGTVWTTQAQRDNPSPFNTYVHTGLPPSPIGSPGEKTIEAALNPAQGDWLYFVPIDLETGETAFANSYSEHQSNVAKLKAWCAKTKSPNCD